MKIHKSIVLLLALTASSSFAQHPWDFVSEDALSVLSVNNGEAVNAIVRSIGEKTDFEEIPNFLSLYLMGFVDDVSAIDFSSELIIAIEPTSLTDGQKPKGMFGPMPHVVFICKPKEGHTVKIKEFSNLKTSVMHDGWFIATGGNSGGDSWSPPTTEELSPIISMLPKRQISFVVNFSPLWTQFGPIVQMTGGMAIGQLSKPGADGVISKRSRKQAATASMAFRELMQWCAQVESISIGIEIKNYIAVADVSVSTKNPEDFSADNSSMIEMASMLADDMVQYAMTGKLTRLLLNADLDSIQNMGSFPDGLPLFVTESLYSLADLAQDNVVSYGLSPRYGLTISSLTDVADQDVFLKQLPEVMDDITEMFKESMHMELTPADEPFTWDVGMISSADSDAAVMRAVFPESDQFKIRKQGKKRISASIGPKSWNALIQSHSTPLAQIIKEHRDKVAVEFALRVDAREFTSGFIGVAKAAGEADDIDQIRPSPSAKFSVLLGKTRVGHFLQLKADVLGLSTLMSDVQNAQHNGE